eukprot:1154964-Pelagomonas_calceolata.AAC.2
MQVEETLLTLIEEKEIFWLLKAASPFRRRHKAEIGRASGTWRVSGSARLQDLAHSIPSVVKA